MKLNKQLFLMKAHYFLRSAGDAPVIPFIPVILKNLGFSSVAIGWVFTAYTILDVLIKPLVGACADMLNNRKVMLLMILFVQATCDFLIQYLPPLPKSNEGLLNCDENIVLHLCSEKLKEKCYSEKIILQVNSTKCKVHISSEHCYPFIAPKNKNSSWHTLESNIFQELSFILQYGLIQDDCLSLYLNNETQLSTAWSAFCSEHSHTKWPIFFSCENDLIGQMMKTFKDDHEVLKTSQFWYLFFLLITLRLVVNIGTSLGDSICFTLLGDKPENYGFQRVWASVGWGTFSVISGVAVDSFSQGKHQTDISIAFYLMIILFAMDMLVVSFIEVSEKNKSHHIMKDVKHLFKNFKIIIFMASCILSGVYASFISSFLFWFIEDLSSRNVCASNDWIKTLEGLAISVQCYGGEIPFFFLSGLILKKIGYENAMTLVLVTFGIRFLLYSIISNPWLILPIETLNGITFGLFYATMTIYANVISLPGTETTVQNLISSLYEGAGLSIGTLLGGYLFKGIGTSQTFLYIGCSALAVGLLHSFALKFSKDAKN